VICICLGNIHHATGQHFGQQITDARSKDFTPIEQIENLKKIGLTLESLEYPDTLGFVEYYIAYRYRNLGDQENLIQHATKAISAFKKMNDSEYNDYRYSFSYSMRALANQSLGNKKEAFADADTIQMLPLSGRGYYALGDALKLQVGIFRMTGDFESSINKLNSFILSSDFKKISNYFKSNMYLELSMAYSNYEDSLSLGKALEAIDSVNAYIPYVTTDYGYKDKTKVLALSQLGHINAAFQNTNQSIEFYKNALLLANSMPLDGDVNRFRLLSKVNLIDLYIKTKEFAKIELLTNNTSSSTYENEPTIGSAYLENLATYYRKIGNLDFAKKHLDKAKEILSHPGTSLQTQAYKQRLAPILLEEIELNLADWALTNHDKHLQQAAETMVTLDSLVELIGLELLFDSSILDLRKSAKKYYDAGIKIAYHLNDEDLFWNYAEKTKSLSLLENVLRNQLLNRNEEYDLINQRLNELKQKKGEIEGRLSTTLHDQEREELQHKLIQLKEEQLNVYLEEQNKLKIIVPEVVSLKDVKDQLNNKSLVLYANDGLELYGLSITQGKSRFHKLVSLVDLNKEIDQFNLYLQQQIPQSKSLLFSILLKPFMSLEDRTVIIPDENLSGIPFAVLKDNNGQHLIHNFTFSTDVSATMHVMHLQDQRIEIRKAAVFRPDYIHSAFENLEFSKQEGKEISVILNADYYNGNLANIDAFKTAAESHHMLHFSGHLEKGRSESYSSRMILTGGEAITDNDIYHQETGLKFVFLNACESASGKILIGEGTSNMARSFMQSGTQTIVQTLWNINDYSSSKIGLSFYKALQKKMNVDDALRSAQLAYLAESDDFERHPYYWGSFLVMGKTDAMTFNSGFSGSYVILGLILIGGILWVVVKRTKARFLWRTV